MLPPKIGNFCDRLNCMNVLLQLVVGALVGILVGITGTGGAFVIPALIYVFRMEQLRAQGTALMISSLPIWFIAFIPYARARRFRSSTWIADSRRHLYRQYYFGASFGLSISTSRVKASAGQRASFGWGTLSLSGITSVDKRL